MKLFLVTALAGLAASQWIDTSFQGSGHIYAVEGQTWPWGPDDPQATTVGCLNSNGKLVAVGSGCAVYKANNGIITSNTNANCGWTPRQGDSGAQPSVFNCNNPAYYPLYRLNGHVDNPDYLSYGSGYLGWSADSGSAVDVYTGEGWGSKVILLWFKKL